MKTLFVITLAASALIGVVGWLDRDGGMNDEWARLLPMNILEHGPSPVQHRLALLEERIRRTREEITRLRQDIEHARVRRMALEQQLQAQETEDATTEAKAASEIRVLRRSIERNNESVQNLELRLAAEAERLQTLEVALLAVQNGLDPWPQDGPIEFEVREQMEIQQSGREHPQEDGRE